MPFAKAYQARILPSPRMIKVIDTAGDRTTFLRKAANGTVQAREALDMAGRYLNLVQAHVAALGGGPNNDLADDGRVGDASYPPGPANTVHGPADSVAVDAQFRRMRYGGCDMRIPKAQRVSEVVRATGPAIYWSSLTGMAGLREPDSPLQEFGNPRRGVPGPSNLAAAPARRARSKTVQRSPRMNIEGKSNERRRKARKHERSARRSR
jgi:hypothetical protein